MESSNFIPTISEAAQTMMLKMRQIPRKGIREKLSRKITDYTGCSTMGGKKGISYPNLKPNCSAFKMAK